MANNHAHNILHAQAILGEGALWNPEINKLLWVDIDGCAIHIFNPETGKDIMHEVSSKPGTVVPCTNGSLIIALQTGIYEMDVNSGSCQFITNPISNPAIRFNDGKCDPVGRFWVGTKSATDKPDGKLFCMERDRSVREVLANIYNSNGLCWSVDNTRMYYIDTPTLTVQSFKYDIVSGNISDPEPIIKIPPGHGFPDGMTIDSDNNLWIALWGAGRVVKFDPQTGNKLDEAIVDAPNTSSCTFGGKDLSTLFITTAREDLSEQQIKQYPASGNLFAAQTTVKGVPAFLFNG